MWEHERLRAMNDESDAIAAWVARELLPHEGVVRNWLSRHWGRVIDVDDVIQEAYCRVSALSSIDHINNGRAYFFRTVQAVATDAIRRAKGAQVRPMTEIDWLNVIDEGPLADRAVTASQELERVKALLSKLSWTCRRVIELRRIEGLSQKETARALGVSESVVENHIVRGLKSVLKAMAEQDGSVGEEEVKLVGKPRVHK